MWFYISKYLKYCEVSNVTYENIFMFDQKHSLLLNPIFFSFKWCYFTIYLFNINSKNSNVTNFTLLVVFIGMDVAKIKKH